MLDLRILQICPDDEPYKAYMVIDKGLINELLKYDVDIGIAKKEIAKAKAEIAEAEAEIAEAEAEIAEAEAEITEAKSAEAEEKTDKAKEKIDKAKGKKDKAKGKKDKATRTKFVYEMIDFKKDTGDYSRKECATYSVEDDGKGSERTNCLFKHLEEFYIYDRTPDILDRRKISVDGVLMDSAEFSDVNYSAIEQDVGYATKIFLYDLEPPNKDISATKEATSEATAKGATSEPVAKEAPLNYIFLVKRYKSKIDLSEELEIVVLNYEPESYYPIQKYAGISSPFGKIRTVFSELENSGVMLVGTQSFDITNFFRQNYLKFYYIPIDETPVEELFDVKNADKIIVDINEMLKKNVKNSNGNCIPTIEFRKYINSLDPPISVKKFKKYLNSNKLIKVNDKRLDYNTIIDGKQRKVIFFLTESMADYVKKLDTTEKKQS